MIPLDILMPILRGVHVLTGVYWAGAIFLLVEFVEPSLRASGPAGGAVMRDMVRRGYLRTIPIVAVLTAVSGLWLYWIVSGHLNSGWGHSPFGTSITVGAAAALVALVLGWWKLRPIGYRLAGLLDRIASASSDEEREQLQAEVGPLRDTFRKYLRASAVLLLVAVLGMGIARYL